MRHRSSAWLAAAVGATVLGLLIGSAHGPGRGERDTAATRPLAASIVTRTAAAISAAAADSVLQMIVTTPQGVSRAIIDDPGQATELVHNRAGATLSESAIRKLPGPAGRYESRTVNFVAGSWSQATRVDTPGAPGGAGIETPAEVITARLHHRLGLGTGARVARATTVDGARAYVVVLTGPGGPPATVWISRSTWLPLQSASPGVSVTYEWTAPGTLSAATLWPDVPAGLVRVPTG